MTSLSDIKQYLYEASEFMPVDAYTIQSVTNAFVVDKDWVVACAWDLVEDGIFTYGADAVFRRTQA